MKILGFNFTKINVEKFKERTESLKINTNIDISEISEVKTELLKTDESILGVVFTYTLTYEPGFAKIELKGNLLLSLEPKIAQDVLNDWENKNMPKNFKLDIFNFILRKSGIRALQLEEEMNLPLHMPLPSISNQSEEKK